MSNRRVHTLRDSHIPLLRRRLVKPYLIRLTRDHPEIVTRAAGAE